MRIGLQEYFWPKAGSLASRNGRAISVTAPLKKFCGIIVSSWITPVWIFVWCRFGDQPAV